MKQLPSFLGDLSPLASFSSDFYRLMALIVIAAAAIAGGAVGPISKAWLEDRMDARVHE